MAHEHLCSPKLNGHLEDSAKFLDKAFQKQYNGDSLDPGKNGPHSEGLIGLLKNDKAGQRRKLRSKAETKERSYGGHKTKPTSKEKSI